MLNKIQNIYAIKQLFDYFSYNLPNALQSFLALSYYDINSLNIFLVKCLAIKNP